MRSLSPDQFRSCAKTRSALIICNPKNKSYHDTSERLHESIHFDLLLAPLRELSLTHSLTHCLSEKIALALTHLYPATRETRMSEEIIYNCIYVIPGVESSPEPIKQPALRSGQAAAMQRLIGNAGRGSSNGQRSSQSALRQRLAGFTAERLDIARAIQ